VEREEFGDTSSFGSVSELMLDDLPRQLNPAQDDTAVGSGVGLNGRYPTLDEEVELHEQAEQ
jgi:hypothetical protein